MYLIKKIPMAQKGTKSKSRHFPPHPRYLSQKGDNMYWRIHLEKIMRTRQSVCDYRCASMYTSSIYPQGTIPFTLFLDFYFFWSTNSNYCLASYCLVFLFSDSSFFPSFLSMFCASWRPFYLIPYRFLVQSAVTPHQMIQSHF